MTSVYRFAIAVGLFLGAMTSANAASAPVTAIVTAFAPEWNSLVPLIAGRREFDQGGARFAEGQLTGLPVLLVQSGVGPVNAASATQEAIDRFHVRRIIVAGIAGAVDPHRHVGDVVVPDRWSEYLESVLARSSGDSYALPGFASNKTIHFGMIYPQPALSQAAPADAPVTRWFAVDPTLLDIARDVAASIKLERCFDQSQCLGNTPSMLVGGSGVSGAAFVDNADFREFLAHEFKAQAADMESAAVAHVASANGIPFIAFRSLSDLAGGEQNENEMKAFEAMASQEIAVVVKAFIGRLANSRPR